MRAGIKECMDKLKIYYGMYPYNKPSNIAYLDRYFYKSIRDEFDLDTLLEAEKEIERMNQNEMEQGS